VEHGSDERFDLRDEDEPGRVIRGRLLPPAAPREGQRWPAVLVLHGFKGFMDWGFFPELGRRLARAGMAAVLFNTSGSGIGPDLERFSDEDAFEHNTFSRELEDVQSVHRWMGTRPEIDLERVGLFGHSRGGGVALLHAAGTDDLRAVATWAAISSIERFSEDVVSGWRERGFLVIHNSRTGQDLRLGTDVLEDVLAHRQALDIRAACGRIRTPTLLLHGTEDESVAFEEALALERAFPDGVARLSTHRGAGHTFGAKHPLEEVPESLDRALQETVEHFARHVL